MNIIERPGISPKWQKKMKTWFKGWEWGGLEEGLWKFADHGILSGPDFAAGSLSGDKLMRKWNSFLRPDLGIYAYNRELDFQRCGSTGGGVDATLMARTFTAIYLKDLIGFYGGSCRFEDTPFTFLGLLLGCKEQTFRILRLRLAYFRVTIPTGLIPDVPDHYPIFHFMLLLIADYLGEKPHLKSGKGVEEPIYRDLLARWRDPDPAALEEICLAACDFHTHSCWREFQDFYSGHFMYNPIEILTLFKLRQYLGLQNPELDHPLMTGPFGKLPPETGCEPDDLIRRVRERMDQDGFDEAKVIALYYPDGNMPPAP